LAPLIQGTPLASISISELITATMASYLGP
jgi:hypothetical protein